jgi:thymidine kinase
MSLSVYPGPMFSGKTTRLLQEIARYTGGIIDKRKNGPGENEVLIINSIKDNRDLSNVISSHSPFYKGLSDKIDIIATENLSDVNVEKYSIIGIDECNFFKDLYETVKKWLSEGKHIICVGLDGDYKMEKFGNISELLHIADRFEKLSAICSLCLDRILLENGSSSCYVISPDKTVPAPFTMRTSDSKELELIGGSEKYRAVCRKCHSLN